MVKVAAAAEIAQDLGDRSVRVHGDDDVGAYHLAGAALIVDPLPGAIGANRSFAHPPGV